MVFRLRCKLNLIAFAMMVSALKPVLSGGSATSISKLLDPTSSVSYTRTGFISKIDLLAMSDPGQRDC